jgi:hypothetical protein
MPRDPEEETIEVTEGEAPEYGEASGEESFGFEEIPDSVFDEKQRGMGRRRKPAGPPLPDEDDGLEGPEAADVPPTVPEPEPEPESEPEGVY